MNWCVLTMRLIDKCDIQIKLTLNMRITRYPWIRPGYYIDGNMTLHDKTCLHSDPFQFYKSIAKDYIRDGIKTCGVACSDGDGDSYIEGGMMHNTLNKNAFICSYGKPLKNRALNSHPKEGRIV